MNRRSLGLALVAVGLVLAILSGLADVIGIGGSGAAAEEFGWKQIVGVAAGVVIGLAGLAIALTGQADTRRSESPNEPAG